MADVSRKIGASSNLVFLILIVLGFLVLINFVSSRHFGRLDVTKNKLYTLSASSKRIAADLDDVVTITCYFSKNLPSYVVNLKRQVNDILDEYRAYARGNIQVAFVDPAEDPVVEQKLRFMGIPQVQLNIMEKDQATATNVYLGIAVQYGDKQEVIPFVKDVINLEYEITSSILKVTRKEQKTVGFLTGHEEYSPDENCQTIHNALLREYAVESVSLAPGNPVAETIDVLVVAGPARLSERDKYEIDQYIMRGGKVIFLIDIITLLQESVQASYRETNLDDLLENCGVQVTKNLVLDQFNMVITFQSGYTVIRTPYPFYLKAIKDENGFDPDNPIVNQLNAVVFPWVSALKPLSDRHPELRFTILAKSSQYSWIQKGMYDLSPLQEFMPEPEDVKAYPLAMLVSGKFKSLYADKEVPPANEGATGGSQAPSENRATVKQCERENQVLVVGNGRFINDNFAGIPGNAAFFLNAVNWFTWGKDLIEIRSRLVLDQPLPFLTEKQKTAIRVANLGGVPILVALFGIIRFYIRRKKKITLESFK